MALMRLVRISSSILASTGSWWPVEEEEAESSCRLGRWSVLPSSMLVASDSSSTSDESSSSRSVLASPEAEDDPKLVFREGPRPAPTIDPVPASTDSSGDVTES